MAYSTDLREKVIEYIEEGNPLTEACRIFKVSRQTLYQWRKLKEIKGSVERQAYKHGAIKLNDQEFIKFVKANPDLYLKDYAAKFDVTPSGIWRAFKRLGITFKKK
jgi:putative transposase